MDYATKQTIMATIINNPGSTEEGGATGGIIIGIVVLFVAVGLFVLYGLPALGQNAQQPAQAIDVKVELPTPAPSEGAGAPVAPALTAEQTPAQ